MSVRPVRFNADGSIDVIHDDAPGPGGTTATHVGTLTAAALIAGNFLTLPGAATPDHRFFALPCPTAGCGTVSVHPIGGGAAPAAVQELFVRVIRRLGCPCGLMPAGRPVPLVQAHVKLETERMDGTGRWVAGTLT